MDSGASASLFLDENPAINLIAISSQKSRRAYFIWFVFLKSYNTKCRHSLCWCLQNTRGCICHALTEKLSTSYFMLI